MRSPGSTTARMRSAKPSGSVSSLEKPRDRGRGFIESERDTFATTGSRNSFCKNHALAHSRTRTQGPTRGGCDEARYTEDMIVDYPASDRPAGSLIARELAAFAASSLLFPFGLGRRRRTTRRAREQRTVV